MSTPKPSLVKWVRNNHELMPTAESANIAYPDEAVPVIPLADLTELVEGLRDATEVCTTADNAYSKGYTDGRMDVLTVLLTQLETHKKEG